MGKVKKRRRQKKQKHRKREKNRREEGGGGEVKNTRLCFMGYGILGSGGYLVGILNRRTGMCFTGNSGVV